MIFLGVYLFIIIMKQYLLFFLLFSVVFSPETKAQSQFSITPGIYLNGGFQREYTSGVGAILGVEYMPRENHFFALELRPRFGHYSFDDGTSWRINDNGVDLPIRNKARLEYKLLASQIGIVPKFYLHFDESISLFLENEFSGGLMTGKFEYGGIPPAEKRFTEPIFNYCVGVGFEYRKNQKWSLMASGGYSTLNFRSNIRKHQPVGYQGEIPNQNTIFMINIILKVRVKK